MGESPRGPLLRPSAGHPLGGIVALADRRDGWNGLSQSPCRGDWTYDDLGHLGGGGGPTRGAGWAVTLVLNPLRNVGAAVSDSYQGRIEHARMWPRRTAIRALRNGRVPDSRKKGSSLEGNMPHLVGDAHSGCLRIETWPKSSQGAQHG